MYTGMMVSGDQLLIGGRTRVPQRRVDALLQHEIGTHLVTRYNGHHQPFQQLEVGLAGYDGLQEGLAVLAEYLVGGLSRLRIRVLAARVVAPTTGEWRVVHRHISRAGSHVRVFSADGLHDRDADLSRRRADERCRLFARLAANSAILREGGELEPLYIGKVASAHLPLIAELRMREIINPPALRPRYLEAPGAKKLNDCGRAESAGTSDVDDKA